MREPRPLPVTSPAPHMLSRAGRNSPRNPARGLEPRSATSLRFRDRSCGPPSVRLAASAGVETQRDVSARMSYRPCAAVGTVALAAGLVMKRSTNVGTLLGGRPDVLHHIRDGPGTRRMRTRRRAARGQVEHARRRRARSSNRGTKRRWSGISSTRTRRSVRCCPSWLEGVLTGRQVTDQVVADFMQMGPRDALDVMRANQGARWTALGRGTPCRSRDRGGRDTEPDACDRSASSRCNPRSHAWFAQLSALRMRLSSTHSRAAKPRFSSMVRGTQPVTDLRRLVDDRYAEVGVRKGQRPRRTTPRSRIAAA